MNIRLNIFILVFVCFLIFTSLFTPLVKGDGFTGKIGDIQNLNFPSHAAPDVSDRSPIIAGGGRTHQPGIIPEPVKNPVSVPKISLPARSGNLQNVSPPVRILSGGENDPLHMGSLSTNVAKLQAPDSISIRGNYAYVISSFHDSLDIIDISDPGKPTHITSIIDGQGGAKIKYPKSVFVSGNYAYIASQSSSALEIIDVSNPTAPVHMSCISDGEGGAKLNSPWSVRVIGNYAYVACNGALEIVDVSNPVYPVHKGCIEHGQNGAKLLGGSSVFVSGNYAYVLAGYYDTKGSFIPAFEIVDISSPANPVHKGCLIDGEGGAVLKRWGSDTSVCNVGNYAYIASANNGLEIIDVSDPTDPVHEKFIGDGDGGAHLSYPHSIVVSGNCAYVTGPQSLEVLDISSPANPVHRGSLVNDDGGAVIGLSPSVSVSGNYAYVVSNNNVGNKGALEVVDITNGAVPSHQGCIFDGEGTTLNSPDGIHVVGNYAYIASKLSEALEIVDISDPSHPVHLSNILNGEGGAKIYSPVSVFVSGMYAYIVGGGGLEIVDITNPASPVHKGNIVHGDGGADLNSPYDIFVSGNYAYVTNYGGIGGFGSLEIIDISNPASPAHKGNIYDLNNNLIFSHSRGVFIKNNYAYVTSINGLIIVDILNPASPAYVNTTSIAGGSDVYVLDNYAYVTSDSSNSLNIVDVSNPASPILMGSITDGTGGAHLSGPLGVHVANNEAYVVNLYDNSLEIITVSDPANPVHRGSIADGDGGAKLSYPWAVFVVSPYAYVASSGSNALEIIKITPGSVPTPTITPTPTPTQVVPTITSITPSTAINSGTLTVTSIAGTGFSTGGLVNMVQLDDGAGHTYSNTTLGTISDTAISGTQFNLQNAVAGTYYVKASKDSGSTWVSSSSRLFTVQGQNPTITSITPSTVYNTDSVTFTRIGGTGFVTDGTVNKIQLNDGAGHLYNQTVLGTVTDTSISGTEFPLQNAAAGTYSVKISKDGGLTWISSSSALLTIQNLPDIASPVHLGSIVNGEGVPLQHPRNVYVQDSIAYIASWASDALEIVDVSNPVHPVHLGKVHDGDGGAHMVFPETVFVVGNYVYVVGNRYLEIIDVSNPASPLHKGSILHGEGGADLNRPQGLFVSGNYAYVTNLGGTDGFGSLEIIDISNPESPVHAGNIFDLESNLIFDNAHGVFVKDNLAYVTSVEGLLVVDVSVPSSPAYVGKVMLHGARNVYVLGNYAYVACYESYSLQIVDISNPASPVLVGSIAHGDGGAQLDGAWNVFVVNNYAFVVSLHSNALEIIDVSDPTAPFHAYRVADGDNGAKLSEPRGIFVSNPYVYVTSVGSNALEIVGFTIPSPTPPPTLSSVTPSTAPNTGPVSITNLAGTGFVSGATVKLTRTGYTDIVATNVVVAPTKITCTIPVTGRMPGQWNVVVTNPGGSPAILKNCFTITGNVPPPVVAKFYGIPDVEVFPYTVHFYDVSTGYPASRSWSFGDGTSSTEQNPTHTYETPGIYDVTLTVSDGVTVSQSGGVVSLNAEES